MPYTTTNPPARISKLPKAAQAIWIAAFNSAYAESKNEESANKVAWSAVKKKYKKVGDNWVKKDVSEDNEKKLRLQSSITKTEESKGDWIIWGYASTFDIDSGGDQITKSALIGAKDDFIEYSTVLFNHTFDRPIGKVVDSTVDDIGLLIKIVISKTEKELWTKVKEGIISKFSVAGRILEETQTENGIYQINKIRFHEVSLVSVPANKNAEAVDDYTTKSEEDKNMNITKKLKEIVKTRTAKEIKENIQNLVDELEAGSIKNDKVEKSSIADIFAEWTNVEKNEIAIYASSDGSGDIDKIDWDMYKQCFAWYDPENTKSVDGYKLQHHTVKDGKLVVVWKGVADAMTELLGTKGKANIPDEDIETAYEHLAQHYTQFDKKIPEKKVSYELLEDEDNAMINGLQILAGKLSGEDKEAVDSAISFIQAKTAELADKHEQICNFDDENEDRPVYQLNSSTNIALSEDGTFKKQILKYGNWYHWNAKNGVLKITKELVSNIVDNFKQKIIENVSVPLTHTDDPSKNTGRVVDLIQTDKGLDAIIEVKDKTIAQKIKDDLIKCISASIDPNYRVKTSNKFVGATLLHAALVQEPFIKGMRGFVPLSDDFAGRPVYQFEDTELSVQQELVNIKQQLIKLSMENEDDKKTDDTKEEDVETKDETDDTKDDTKKEDESTDEKKEDTTEDDKSGEDEKGEGDKEEKTDEVSDDEISKSFDATLDECAQELVKSSKIDKSKYTACVKTQMKDGKKLAEAVKICKAKVKKQLSETPSEDKKSDEVKDVQQTDTKEKVDMSDAENMYKEYLEKGQIVPAQKEAFIQLFATTKALNLSEDKVELHKILKTFLDAQTKVVDFSEKGTDATGDADNSKTDDAADIPEDVKKFYSEKMGFDEETMKEAWSHAQELKSQEDEMKETIFDK